MNAQKTNNDIKVLKETKNKIRVDFDRTPLLERLKLKFFSVYFLQNVVWYLFRLILMIGVSFIILYPFFTKITGSFMAQEDFVDVTVRLIPRNWTLDTYKAIWTDQNYFSALTNTTLLSLLCAVVQMFVCCTIGYGLAKFKFKGSNLLFFLVILTMLVPHSTVQLAMFMHFRYFDIWGIIGLLGGEPFDLVNSFWPLALLSFTGLAFKNGLYIFMLRQFFRGVPDELEESAYVDGSGPIRTFIQIILPLSIPMLITVFLFSFSWQWTDDFYTNVFFPSSEVTLMPDIVGIPTSLTTDYAGKTLFYTAIYQTEGLMILLPLIVIYLFCQRYLIQGIERSGIVG